MPGKRTLPYGAWRSPISADLIVSQSIGLSGVSVDGDVIYWLESRPMEGGRTVLVRHDREGTRDLTPAGFNVRTRAHEYGGGACTVADEVAWFVNDADQRLYRQGPGRSPTAITPADGCRYADLIVDRERRRIVCVREDHRTPGEPENCLVSFAMDGEAGEAGAVLVAGHDFVASPALSPDGRHLAWLTWDHPDMPWDASELWLAPLRADGSTGEAVPIAGGPGESVFQPQWSPGGELYFVSDRGGWWNLYRLHGGSAQPVCPMAAEFGLPQWVFGMSTYAFTPDARLFCCYSRDGLWRLAEIDLDTGTLVHVDTPYTSIAGLRAGTAGVLFTAGSGSEATAVVRLDPRTGEREVLQRESSLNPDPGYLSLPQPISFPSEDGLTAHALYYPPRNRDHQGPEGERPPLLVKSHGGPTAATSASLNLAIQYWTSRGFGVLDVNYGGSTGYGRAYRERLYGNWGITDVDDCTNGALFLARRGDVDPQRLVIRGSSAGGYTTLAALTFRDTFSAGASLYGISELESLARDTHKFESRYLDRLVGPYPQDRETYLARSPIHHAERLSVPVIFFQGLEDKVVPPDQAERMVAALRAKGLPVAYVAFEGEQHGFRQAANIKRALEAELYFYARIFGFEPADRIEPVPIENLEASA